MFVLTAASSKEKFWKYFYMGAWFFVFAATSLLSIFGRKLQRFLVQEKQFPLEIFVAIIISTVSVLLLLHFLKTRGPKALYHFLWIVPVALFIHFFFPIVEERIHFLTFGPLGFLSFRWLVPSVGLLVCIFCSAFDELLQWYLPDRVGELRDVQMNVLASFLGAWIALRTGQKAN